MTPRTRAKPNRKKLTVPSVKAANPRPDRDVLVWDTELKNFLLQVRPSGRKAFYVQYRNERGRQRRFKLGSFPSLTPEKARREAIKRLGEVEGEIDIQYQRQKRRKAREVGMSRVETWSELFTYRLNSYAIVKNRTWRDDQRRFEKEIEPAIGHLKLGDARKQDDFLPLYLKVWNERGGYEAERMRALVSALYNLAVNCEFLPKDAPNPAKLSKVERFEEKPREEPVREDDLPALLEAIGKHESPYIRALFRVLLLTGLRFSEVRERKWDDFDRGKRTIKIGLTKSGKTRRVPLSEEAMEVILAIPRMVTSPYIFPSPVSPTEKAMSRSWAFRQWDQIRRGAGLPDVRIHDLRHTVATSLADAGQPAQYIQQALGHQALATTMRYVHAASEGSRQALSEHGQRLKDLESWR